MNNRHPFPTGTAHAANERAKNADGPIARWARSLDQVSRSAIAQTIAQRSEHLARDPNFAARVDARESAMTACLFLIYAEAQGLAPDEVASLLDKPGNDGPAALDTLGLSTASVRSIMPGRNEHHRHTPGTPRNGSLPGRN